MAERPGRLRTWLLIALAHDTFWVEVCVALAACAWAKSVWLMPGDLVDRPAYAAIARFASDELWDAMGCLGGAVQLVAAFAHRRIPRFLVAVLMGSFWLFLADGVAANAREFTPTVVPYFALAGFNAVCILLPLIRRLPWLR